MYVAINTDSSGGFGWIGILFKFGEAKELTKSFESDDGSYTAFPRAT